MTSACGSVFGYFIALLFVCCCTFGASAFAELPLPPNPQDGASGIQGTVPTPPPKNAATVATPSPGASFSKLPITVSGLCENDLLVKMFSNNVFVGSVMCKNGSYSLQIDLFDGRNDLVARVFDALDQPGPDSKVVTVTYNNPSVVTGLSSLSLSSLYARRGANPGAQLTWPITITGGTAPYALSVDWGDGKPASLQSEPSGGNVTIGHTYDTAGSYIVIVKVTDKNGMTAFLQLAGQANGAVVQQDQQSKEQSGLVAIKTSVIWIPAAMSIPLILVAFWLGRRFEITELRKRLEQPDDK